MSLESLQPQVRSDRPDGPFSSTPNLIERLPMLPVVLERVAGACAENLRGATSLSAQIVMQGVESAPAGEKFASLEGANVAGVLFAAKWDARLIVCVDRGAVFTLVDMLLGGDGTQPPYTAERPFSKLEIRIAGTFFHRLAQALSLSFAQVAETPFVVEASSDRFDFDAVGGLSAQLVVATFRFDLAERGGEFIVGFPKSVFGPMRQALSRARPKEPAKADPRWSQRIQSEITRTNVGLKAVLDERWITLDEVSSLKVGQVMRLNATPTSRVRVECNDEPLLWCQLGKSNGVYTLRVDEFIDPEQEFLDDILFG